MEKEVGTEGRGMRAGLGLTRACCRPGAGRSRGSPSPKFSRSRDAPWPRAEPSCGRRPPSRSSEGRDSAQPPIGCPGNQHSQGQRLGHPPGRRGLRAGAPAVAPLGLWSRARLPSQPPLACARRALRSPRGEAGGWVSECTPASPPGGLRAPAAHPGAPRTPARELEACYRALVPRLYAWTPGRPRRNTVTRRRRVWESEHLSV